MGDVGSLALGGSMAVVAVLIKQEILLLFVVQRASGGDLHGRCGLTRPGRLDGGGRGADQAGDPAALHRRGLHGGSDLGDPASRKLQTARRQTHFQDGAIASPFRSFGLDRIEDHCALLDRRAGAGTVRSDDAQIAMNLRGKKTLVVGMKRSGVASAKLLLREGADVPPTDLKPLSELPEAAALGIPFAPQTPEG